jgi:hypothetical protein
MRKPRNHPNAKKLPLAPFASVFIPVHRGQSDPRQIRFRRLGVF